jgi:hypothetical protein
VAGGKGDLSWVLSNAEEKTEEGGGAGGGWDAVVVDPRRTDHSKLVRTATWRAEHPVEAEGQAGWEGFAGLSLAPPFRSPRHLRLFFDEALLSALRCGPSADEWLDFWTAASERAEAEEAEGKGHHQPAGLHAGRSGVGKEGRVTDAREAHATLTSARLLVGFHPDQATEPCIDFALATKTPFVVCPCCVFPKLFPDRRLNGRPVHSYPDFLEYLRRKHPRMRTGVLPFESAAKGHGSGQTRNAILYMLPGDFDDVT